MAFILVHPDLLVEYLAIGRILVLRSASPLGKSLEIIGKFLTEQEESHERDTEGDSRNRRISGFSCGQYVGP